MGAFRTFPESVLNTIYQARASSTRCLYALKWSIFSTWCTTRGTDPVVCDISLILSFLHELLETQRSPSTLKVYVAAIVDSHTPIDGKLVGRNNLVARFLKGSRRLILPCPAYSVEGTEEPSIWAAKICWPSSPDAKNHSATSSSIGKIYGRYAGAKIVLILGSSWNQGDNSLGTSYFGARPGVESTLPCQGVENWYWAFRSF